MKGMTLEDLVSGLEKTAGFEEMKAKAEDKSKKDDEGDEGKSSKEDEGKDTDKKEKKEEQEKSAAFKSGGDLAREIMEKVASIKTEQTNTKDTEMNKQASDAGKALAQALMTKLASAGDTNTSNGFAEGVVPNKTQVDLASQRAEHDRSFQPTPGTDGAGNGGTISEIFDAIVADAQAKTNAVSLTQTASAPADGAINAQAPSQVQVDESREKMAAAISLVNSGVDFDDAVAMIKAASDELEAEHDTHVKQAALNELMDSGVDFDLAIAMVKQAGAVATRTGLAVAKKGMSMGKKVAIAAGAGAATGAAAYAATREKKAALDQLIDHGVDYDQAIELVNNKYQELYGN